MPDRVAKVLTSFDSFFLFIFVSNLNYWHIILYITIWCTKFRPIALIQNWRQ